MGQGLSDLAAIIQPQVPLSWGASMPGRGMSILLSPLCSTPLGWTDAESITWDLQGTSAAPRGNQSSPKAHLNQS